MSHDADIVAKIIRERVTEKVLCDPNQQEAIPDALESKCQQHILSALETAGWAPFHYPRNKNDIAEPWRSYVLWQQEAHKAASYLSDTLGVKTKEPMLASACHALVLVTWLPEFDHEAPTQLSKIQSDPMIARNNEHIAASAAMVQNFLLMLTAHQLGNYWSSGGKFASPEMFEYLGISDQEHLLAAVFIEYPEMQQVNPVPKTRKRGALRDKRSTKWVNVISL